jgi:transcriptional regulator with XRE-family HTH domain
MLTLNTSQKKAHFLGTKIRSLRKQNKMTLDDLAYRCHQINGRIAPSVPYLSLIENGKRNPSEDLLDLLGNLFGKERDWFRDDSTAPQQSISDGLSYPEDRLVLEPGELFKKELLSRAIPELLVLSGISGRQFSHTMIRSYQEEQFNKFPDLERVADEVGGKKFPLSVNDIMKLYKKHGLQIEWYDRPPFLTRNDAGHEIKTLFRSFYDMPNKVYLNKQLEDQPERIKYELALHLAHKVLHDGDGVISSHAAGGELGGSPRPSTQHLRTVTQKDILIAWRDFECSFFAGALLCPRQPFRRFMVRNGYDPMSAKKIGLTVSVIMRRMGMVSSYDHWHYFDLYPPGFIRAAYRGNRIPLPWGSMRSATSPVCPQWLLFRQLSDTRSKNPNSQISLLKHGDIKQLYACISVRTKDAAGNPHIVTVGIDLVPMIHSQGNDHKEILNQIDAACSPKGEALLPDELKNVVRTMAGISNFSWIIEALENPCIIICPQIDQCPREKPCKESQKVEPKRMSWVDEVKEEILLKK